MLKQNRHNKKISEKAGKLKRKIKQEELVSLNKNASLRMKKVNSITKPKTNQFKDIIRKAYKRNSNNEKKDDIKITDRDDNINFINRSTAKIHESESEHYYGMKTLENLKNVLIEITKQQLLGNSEGLIVSLFKIVKIT